jgi:hypothetical protein
MKVIVKIAGFYGGTYYKASKKEIDFPDAIAKPFMAPYGDGLEAVKPDDTAVPKPEPKAADKKAG